MLYVGLAGIIWSIFVISPASQFPAPWAMAPVLATALVIASGIGGSPASSPLTHKSFGYVGNISYSLYLWHFPVIIFAGALFDISSPIVAVASVVAMGALSVVFHYLVEKPVQHSQWLEPKRRKTERASVSNRYKLGWLGLLAAITAGVIVLALNQPKPDYTAMPATATAIASAQAAKPVAVTPSMK
ncbi:acyltransferase family protein, partial [Micrococcus luteus]|uniref:acyltransferase family protein n=2 Tax=Micrococcaceae TaxID=1268 RepID=UPI003F7DB80C